MIIYVINNIDWRGNTTEVAKSDGKGKDHTFCVYTEQFILMMLIWMEMIVMVMGWIMAVYRLANGLLSMHTNTPSN